MCYCTDIRPTTTKKQFRLTPLLETAASYFDMNKRILSRLLQVSQGFQRLCVSINGPSFSTFFILYSLLLSGVL